MLCGSIGNQLNFAFRIHPTSAVGTRRSPAHPEFGNSAVNGNPRSPVYRRQWPLAASIPDRYRISSHRRRQFALLPDAEERWSLWLSCCSGFSVLLLCSSCRASFPVLTSRDSWPALIASLVIGLLNATVGFFLKIITFPLSILTLGIFLLVINGLMILLASGIVPGFHVAALAPPSGAPSSSP